MPSHHTAGELSRPFGLVPSTASAKAAEIRKRVRLSPLDAPWPLPELIEDNPALWTFSLNGFIANARTPWKYSRKRQCGDWFPMCHP